MNNIKELINELLDKDFMEIPRELKLTDLLPERELENFDRDRYFNNIKHSYIKTSIVVSLLKRELDSYPLWSLEEEYQQSIYRYWVRRLYTEELQMIDVKKCVEALASMYMSSKGADIHSTDIAIISWILNYDNSSLERYLEGK